MTYKRQMVKALESPRPQDVPALARVRRRLRTPVPHRGMGRGSGAGPPASTSLKPPSSPRANPSEMPPPVGAVPRLLHCMACCFGLER